MNWRTIHSIEINSLQPAQITISGIIRLHRSSFTMLSKRLWIAPQAVVTEKKMNTEMGSVTV